jgi:hypothetical protein
MLNYVNALLSMKEAKKAAVSAVFFYCIGKFALYSKKALRAGCAPRGYEDSCYATSLGRERVASDSLF